MSIPRSMTVPLPECVDSQSTYVSDATILSRLEALKNENARLRTENTRLVRDATRETKADIEIQKQVSDALDEARRREMELRETIMDYDSQVRILQQRVSYLDSANVKLERTLVNLKDKLNSINQNSLKGRQPALITTRPMSPRSPSLLRRTLCCGDTIFPPDYIICEPTLSPGSIHDGLTIKDFRIRN